MRVPFEIVLVLVHELMDGIGSLEFGKLVRFCLGIAYHIIRRWFCLRCVSEKWLPSFQHVDTHIRVKMEPHCSDLCTRYPHLECWVSARSALRSKFALGVVPSQTVKR